MANIAEFLTRKNAISAKYLLFGILTVLRQSEFRCARWDEIDFEAETLTVPPERRKDKRTEPFVVLLSRQAVELLKSLPQVGEHIFTVDRDSGPLCPTCLFHYMKRATKEPVTIHGTRSTFSD